MEQPKPRAKRQYVAPELTSYGTLQQKKGERSMYLEGTGNMSKCRLGRCQAPPSQFKYNC